jgi:hypothetical protein
MQVVYRAIIFLVLLGKPDHYRMARTQRVLVAAMTWDSGLRPVDLTRGSSVFLGLRERGGRSER